MSGDFFAIGKPQWAIACELGLNPAVAFLTLGRGTGRDNRSTAWSAEAVSKYSGMTWRRAKEAIHDLQTKSPVLTSRRWRQSGYGEHSEYSHGERRDKRTSPRAICD
jgi:hypothetical protein